MRTSRSVVEFMCEGMWYCATFSHTHVRSLPKKLTTVERHPTSGRKVQVTKQWMEEDPRGIPNQVAKIRVQQGDGYRERSFPQRIRHITRCIITLRNASEPWGEGKAKCSMSDPYIWRKGISLAFNRALDDSIPDMPKLQKRMRESFYLAMAVKAEDYSSTTSSPKQVKAKVIGLLPAAAGRSQGHVPPVTPPGRSRVLPRLPGTPIGFVPIVTKDGVNLLLSPMQALERGIPTPDQIIEAEVLAADYVEPEVMGHLGTGVPHDSMDDDGAPAVPEGGA